MRTTRSGFTLIELSIVLVIIGLITGGILTGRDLIEAASTRAQIAQIEKYNTAVNTFKGKYGYLPGDIPAASQFGFLPRGSFAGQGDGNGLIEGVTFNGAGANNGAALFAGETQAFWTDLSTANMIDAGLSQNNVLSPPASLTLAQLPLYLPKAKIGRGNFVYAWSGGWKGEVTGVSDGFNYFGIEATIDSWGNGFPAANVGLTVTEAYNIDTKVDDGLPQSGHVQAFFDSPAADWAASGNFDPMWGSESNGDNSSTTGGPVTSAGDIGDGMAAGSGSCYDGSAGLPERYSMGQNKGAGLNCALSFRMQ